MQDNLIPSSVTTTTVGRFFILKKEKKWPYFCVKIDFGYDKEALLTCIICALHHVIGIVHYPGFAFGKPSL